MFATGLSFKIQFKISLLIIALGILPDPDCFADKGSGESGSGSLSSQPPDTVALYSPFDLSLDVPVTVEFSWYRQIHSSYYQLQLSAMPDFSALLIDQVNITDTIYRAGDLALSTTHYWRVRAMNVAGEGAFSDVWGFTTSKDPTVGLDRGSAVDMKDLLTVFPNPFNRQTSFRIRGFQNQDIVVTIVGSNGQCIWKIQDHPDQNGTYEMTWDGCDQHGIRVGDGLYLVVLQIGKHLIYRKIMKIE